MRNAACVHETELLAALQGSRWPDACDESLRTHVGSCPSCTQLADLALALLEDHRSLVLGAPVPSSAIVWWRAQMRSRREAAERATQPIMVIQGLAAACAAGVLIAAAGFFGPTFRGALDWLGGAANAVTGLGPMLIGVAAAIGLALIIAPLALYFTFHEE